MSNTADNSQGFNTTHNDDSEPPIVPVLLAGKGILQPEPDDIICGRGKSIAHKGNAKFRELINAKKDEYQAARRREDKTRLTMEIVRELRQSSRFLLKDPKLQLWFEVGEEYMKEKVSHALRSRPSEERRRRLKPKKKTVRKQTQSPAVEEAADSLIREQQALLKAMIEREGGAGNGTTIGCASLE
ncbi:expressed unknown protein [Seminavis robusta]|uniref:DUF6824 domain-containing protein n=1 Tax=Seminavis robusta TaxID=568900 RepID=A0A9N8HEV7_9STRA|nr:expressed unknown protein [Seminavis robusta]|eukprot:Sro536_g162060.1 n/a (186) ;mRNA; r:3576-4133